MNGLRRVIPYPLLFLWASFCSAPWWRSVAAGP